MATCKDCVHYEVCKRIDYELEYHNKSIKEAEEELPIKCRFFKNKADVVPVVRCKDCKYSRELDKHCEINRTAYLHCALLKGDETKYVWHKYKKYYKDYSIVEPDDFCSYGERKNDNGNG